MNRLRRHPAFDWLVVAVLIGASFGVIRLIVAASMLGGG